MNLARLSSFALVVAHGAAFALPPRPTQAELEGSVDTYLVCMSAQTTAGMKQDPMVEPQVFRDRAPEMCAAKHRAAVDRHVLNTIYAAGGNEGCRASATDEINDTLRRYRDEEVGSYLVVYWQQRGFGRR